MSLKDWAKDEIKRAGLFDADSDYGGAIGEALMEHVELFSKQGHSGGSAWVTRAALARLLAYQPLTPIASDPSEWCEVSSGMWQSARCPSKFSNDGGKTWYDIDKPLRFQRLRRILGLRIFAP